MRTDVIVKTWYNDLSFCSYCLRFLEKYWQEPNSKIIVLANRDCEKVCRDWRFSERVRYFYVDPWPDGNQFQCYLTLLCDHFSDADMFAIFDSDTMLLRPITVSDRMVDDKPVIYFEPVSELAKKSDRVIAHNLWFPIMEYWVELQPQADYMFAFPFVYRADTIRAVRRLITAKTSKGLLESLYSGVPFEPAKFLTHPFRFCEHNVIAFYAATHELDRYHLRSILDVTDEERAHWPVKQYHSWSQWNAERIDEFETMLRA